MSRRPTLAAVAQAAGVSSATVDRVLNSRLPVREATALKVVQAAERIGYHGAALMRERQRERAPVRTLGFCLQKRDDPFYQAFARELSAAAGRQPAQRCLAVVAHMDALDPAGIARQLLALGHEVDALAVVAVDHPHVTAAIETLHARGCPVFTLLSDLSAPRRAGYIGVDPRKAGRTAAWAVCRLVRDAADAASPRGPQAPTAPQAPQAPVEVGVFVGSHRYLGQETCEISFRSYLREHAPHWRVIDTRVNLEDPALAYEATLAMLARHPRLLGLYVAGGGAAGILQALREAAPQRHVVTVVNELMDDRRAALIDGIVDVVLGSPLARIAETAVQAMLAALETRAAPEYARQFALGFDFYTPENVV